LILERPINVYFRFKIMKAQIKEYLLQGLVGEASFSIILPIDYAVNLGIAKGDFVKVFQEDGRIVIEKVVENWQNGNR
jgi:formylmethanofuran dehydrogenase subunit D